ncbi:DUF1120 domain-containing protein [Pandoraea sp. NPDC087047]|uniref:DUF1120 domain-containing protein n=1 Tax=Pandoraea sp. NPDC087047 TaxID=3364390 RepID=UPI00381F724F
MMNAVKKSACVFAVLATTSTVVMAQSVDLKVIGTIAPTACTPTLSGGGVVDYGVISAASLKKDAYKELEKRVLDIAITCDAPAKVALYAINGRPASAAGTTESGGFGGRIPVGVSAEQGNWVVGLGLDGARRIGGYNMHIRDVTLDSKPGRFLYQPDGSVAWFDNGTGVVWDRKHMISFGEEGSSEPTAFTNMAGKLNVQAYINKSSELDTNKAIKFGGQMTMELFYL